MFPFTITYVRPIVTTTESDKQQIINKLIDFVKANHANVVRVDDTQLTFTVSLLGNKRDKFSVLDKGTFAIIDDTLKFTFSMYTLFIFTGLMSWYMWYLSSQIWLGIFFFSSLGIGSWIWALVKYKRLINDISESLNKKLTDKSFG